MVQQGSDDGGFGDGDGDGFGDGDGDGGGGHYMITLSFLYSGFEWSSREVMIDFNIVFCTLALRLQGNSFIVDYYDYVDADVVLDLEMIVVQLIMMMMG